MASRDTEPQSGLGLRDGFLFIRDSDDETCPTIAVQSLFEEHGQRGLTIWRKCRFLGESQDAATKGCQRLVDVSCFDQGYLLGLRFVDALGTSKIDEEEL